MPTFSPEEEELNKNAAFRSSRRAARRGRARAGRRQITVHSELREQPDVRKLARAIITMALAEAEREAQAQDEQESGDA